MEIVILSVERTDADRWVARLSLDGNPGRFIVEFRPGGSEIVNYDPEPAIEGTREGKEIAWLLSRLRQGEELQFPHRIDVGDRWPSWPPAGEPQPGETPYPSREIVLLEVRESAPGFWTADVLVDGENDRLVIELPEQNGRRMYHELSVALSKTQELDELYDAIVRASRGESLNYPLRISSRTQK